MSYTTLIASILTMNMTTSSPPYLHTNYLSNAQRALCNENPTYRARISDLHTLHKELQQLRGLLSTGEVGKLPGSTSKRLKKGRGRRGRTALQLQLDTELEKVAAEDGKVLEEEEDRAVYQDLERRMLQWDDECAALAESLLCRPKASLATRTSVCNNANTFSG